MVVVTTPGDCALEEPGDNVGEGDPRPKPVPNSPIKPSRDIFAESVICLTPPLFPFLPAPPLETPDTSSLAALAFVSSTSNVSSHVPLRPFPASDTVRLCAGERSVSVSEMTPSRNAVRGDVDGEADWDIS